MERIAPGAFKKTFNENLARMRVLFQHGQDPQLGDKPLGPIRNLREDDTGAYYEVPLLRDDSGQVVDYIRSLLPGLREKLYGASFRFKVVKEEFDEEPDASDHNPNSLPERTVTEARVMEFGPVTFPAYASATAGLRSVTDEFRFPREVLELIGERAAALRQEEPEQIESGENLPVTATTPELVESRSTQAVHDYLSEKEARPRWQL